MYDDDDDDPFLGGYERITRREIINPEIKERRLDLK